MARVTRRTYSGVHHQPRGWGEEVWIENLHEYCGKLLIINPGKRGSLHFHMEKKETMWVETGRAVLGFVDPETGTPYELLLFPGDSVLIEPGQVHQIINGSEDEILRIFEFSTVHREDDSYRVKKGD